MKKELDILNDVAFTIGYFFFTHNVTHCLDRQRDLVKRDLEYGIQANPFYKR